MPPGPVRVSSRPSRSSWLRLGDLPLAAEERGELGRQVVGDRVRGCAAAGSRSGRPVDHQVPDPLRAGEVLEPMLAHLAQRDARRAASPRPAHGSLAERRTCPPLPALEMRAARCTSSPTYEPPLSSPSPVCRPIRTRIAASARPRLGGEPALRGDRGSDRLRGAAEDDEERVALRPDLDAVLLGPGRPRDLAMPLEQRRPRRRRSSCARRVEPSMSVKRKVTVPVGSSVTRAVWSADRPRASRSAHAPLGYPAQR